MKKHLLLIFIFLVFPSHGMSESIIVGNFETGDMSGWKEKVFSGKTKYQIGQDEACRGLLAKSSSAASGMFKDVRVDLEKTPYLNWKWKIENTYGKLDEQSKAGDDYPARVYVVFSGGIFFWKTKAINYVWSNSQTIGSSWPNAFISNAGMIAIESGDEKLGLWVSEKVNVKEDYKAIFGKEIKYADAVAIMTDSDNGGGSAETCYGNIYFSSE